MLRNLDPSKLQVLLRILNRRQRVGFVGLERAQRYAIEVRDNLERHALGERVDFHTRYAQHFTEPGRRKGIAW